MQPMTHARTVSQLAVGEPLEMPCGCSGKRWYERQGLVWLSIARACPLHQVAMHEGLWVAPHACLKPTVGHPPLAMGVYMTLDSSRPRVDVHAAADGTNVTLCQALVRQRVTDGTWRFGTLVEENALPPSPTDAWLLAEFTAALVQEHGPRGPMAVVAPDDAQFAIATAYERNSAAPAPVPFRTREQAAAWLDSQGF